MLKISLKNKLEKVNFTANSLYEGHHKVTYRGVKAIRCPFDYVIYQMIITDLMPDLVIEIGTNMGGGALYIADLMNIIDHGIIHTIDIQAQSDAILQSHSRIKLFTDGWENYPIEEASGYEKILVIEDASHMYKNTLDAINKFAPLVTKDSYLIVEDGIINELGREKEFEGGPLKAIREFTSTHKEFVIDRKWCDMFGQNATFNVNGYLKKIS